MPTSFWKKDDYKERISISPVIPVPTPNHHSIVEQALDNQGSICTPRSAIQRWFLCVVDDARLYTIHVSVYQPMESFEGIVSALALSPCTSLSRPLALHL